MGAGSPKRLALSVRRVIMRAALPIHDDTVFEVSRADRHFAVTARYVEDVGRLADAGDTAAQLAHQGAAFLDRHAEMVGAGGEVELVQVIGLDPVGDQGAE